MINYSFLSGHFNMNSLLKGTILMGTNQPMQNIEPLIAKKLKDNLI